MLFRSYKIIAKGRRFGLTKGMVMYAIIKAVVKDETRILWVDTIYGNINRYYERYFLPILKNLESIYHYKRQDNILQIKNSYIDFRSVDRPENMEGQAYNIIIINEAGIVLKDRRLWTETILPMGMDYKAEYIIGGTPKGKYTRSKEKHLFYELYEKGLRRKDAVTLGDGQEGESENEFGTGKWESFNFSTYDNCFIDPEEIKEVENEIPLFLRQQEI